MGLGSDIGKAVGRASTLQMFVESQGGSGDNGPDRDPGCGWTCGCTLGCGVVILLVFLLIFWRELV